MPHHLAMFRAFIFLKLLLLLDILVGVNRKELPFKREVYEIIKMYFQEKYEVESFILPTLLSSSNIVGS